MHDLDQRPLPGSNILWSVTDVMLTLCAHASGDPMGPFRFLRSDPTFVQDRSSHTVRITLLMHLIYFLTLILKDKF